MKLTKKLSNPVRVLLLMALATLTILSNLSSASPVAYATGEIVVGSDVLVANTGGAPLRVRSVPGMEGKVLTTLEPGMVATIVHGLLNDASGAAWYQVSANGMGGWVMGQYISLAQAPVKSPEKAAGPAPKEGAGPTVEVRAAPVAEKPIASKPATSKTSSQPVKSPVEEPIPEIAATNGNAAETMDASATRLRGVSLAMQYLGYRYVWGGTTPNGFDCSGFVYYIYNKVGFPMPRDMQSQLASGPRVGTKELQPGDLLFWSNTYKSGLSHEGIYIGDGKFVHAENESTGVVISSMSTTYWASHYTAAVRPR